MQAKPSQCLLFLWQMTQITARLSVAGAEALYPNIFNLAPGSDVSVNATCGAQTSEVRPWCDPYLL